MYQVETTTKEKAYGAYIPSTIDDYGLNPYEFRIYCRLVRRNGKGNEGCYESIASIALACQMSKQKVRDALGVLVKAGIAKKEKRPGYSDRFQLAPQECWNDPQHLAQFRQQVTAYRDRNRDDHDDIGSASLPGSQLPDAPHYTNVVDQGGDSVVDIELPTGGGGNYQTLRIELPGSYKGNTLKVLHLRYSPEGNGPTTAENFVVEDNFWQDPEPTTPEIGESIGFNFDTGKQFSNPGEDKSSAVAAVEVEVVSSFEQSPVAEPASDTRSAHASERVSPETCGQCDSDEELERSREIERIAYNWKLRPWLKSPWEFKGEMIQAVWRSNPKWYCLDGSEVPNLKKITDRLRSLEAKLKGLGEMALASCEELFNYWHTACALTDPQTEQALRQKEDYEIRQYYSNALGGILQ